MVAMNWLKSEPPPVAHTSDFTFTVPSEGDMTVSYIIIVRFYVPSEAVGEYWLKATADDAISNVKLDFKYYKGEGTNVNLGSLEGHHYISFKYEENIGGGELWCCLAKNNRIEDGVAQMTRFRICVPPYSQSETSYGLRTYTYFPSDIPQDKFFLDGYANDFIEYVRVDGNLKWTDWMWDLGPNYGAIYGWQDGFTYPLGQPFGWHDVTFNLGNWGSGFLDFRYISKEKETEKIGEPKFWTKVTVPQETDYLRIYKTEAWTGSEWLSAPGTSMRNIATTIKILANATNTGIFIPASQEAQVTLSLYNLSTLCTKWSHQDIAVVVNVTYNYFIDGSVLYGMPIVFHPHTVEVKLAEQGSMLYEPFPSLVFWNYTHRGFVSPEWKIVKDVSLLLLGY